MLCFNLRLLLTIKEPLQKDAPMDGKDLEEERDQQGDSCLTIDWSRQYGGRYQELKLTDPAVRNVTALSAYKESGEVFNWQTYTYAYFLLNKNII